MKPSMKTVLVLGILMLAAGCTRNPMESAEQNLPDQEIQTQAYEQVLAFDTEAAAIEEEAIADTLPDNIRRHFYRALIRVEKMLDHVRVFDPTPFNLKRRHDDLEIERCTRVNPLLGPEAIVDRPLDPIDAVLGLYLGLW